MAVDYLFVGDDFTGASDTLASLARAGRCTRLFLDPPDAAVVAAEGLDAVGIATDLRAERAGEIARRIDAMAPALGRLAGRFVHYKICSTFDSGPDIGSIGAAVAGLDRHLRPRLVAIIGGQPSLGRYCAFGNLFARGPDGEVHRIDRHPVMRNHPTTPMTEGDLRLHLAAQGLSDIALVALPSLGEGAKALLGDIEAHLAAGRRHILFDACEQGHVETIGAALQNLDAGGRPILIVGASSVAEAIHGVGPPTTLAEAASARNGSCLVIAGSRSSVTAAQVEAARTFDRVPVRARDLAGANAIGALAGRCAGLLASGSNVLVHLLPEEDYGTSGADLARRLAELAAAIFDQARPGMLGVAGGDTSSILVRRLGFESLAFERQLDPGVALCRARSGMPDRDGMRLMLKGGQVGARDLFDRFAGLCR